MLVYGELGAGDIGDAKVDVSIQNGACTLAKGVMGQAAELGVLTDLPFTVPEGGCTDLEVRVWVEAASVVTISLLEIHSVEASASAETAAISSRQKNSSSTIPQPKAEALPTRPMPEVRFSKNSKRKKRR